MRGLFRHPALSARPRHRHCWQPTRLSLLRFEDRVVPALQVVDLGAVHARAGIPFTGIVAAFTDSDGNASASRFTGTIDWGDGQTSQANFGFVVIDPTTGSKGGLLFDAQGDHTYAAA